MTATGPGLDDPFYEDRQEFEVRFGQFDANLEETKSVFSKTSMKSSQ